MNPLTTIRGHRPESMVPKAIVPNTMVPNICPEYLILINIEREKFLKDFIGKIELWKFKPVET